MSQPITILNTSILTNDGEYCLESISLDQAKSLVLGDFVSAVGHESTAEILTELLGISVPVNRMQFAQELGQKALVFKLNGRPPEGQILSREQIEEIGYGFKLLSRTA